MRKILIVLALFLTLSPIYAMEDLVDVDTMNFLESAFDGIKPITNEQFEKTINQLTPQPVPDTFGGKLKTFLFGRKYGVEPAPKGQDKEIDYGGEAKSISDMKNGIYYIKLVVSIIGVDNKIIPLGHYKIQEKTIDNTDYLVFYQANTEYGMLKLRKFQDNSSNNSMTYSRVDIVNDDIVRIVYSTIKDTKCAYARIDKG